MTCPLTDWEQRLRKMAGEGDYTGDFIGYWAHRLIFYDAPPWVFTACTSGSAWPCWRRSCWRRRDGRDEEKA